MSADTMKSASATLVRLAVLGAGAGLVGGVVFGLMMGAQGMLPMVGMLIGQENAGIGFVVHMLISALIGATFGLGASRLPAGWPAALIGGGVYGIIWWVLGALILMPLMLGMNNMVLVIEQMQITSLIGHIIFGVLTGAVFKVFSARF